MYKFVLAPDSFKGTMSSETVCRIMKKAITDNIIDAEVISLPIADGGEGTVDAFLSAVSGEKIYCKAKNPFMEEMNTFYGIIDDGNTAIIEMAACAGLPLAEGKLNPEIATTFGVGELILDALNRGCRRIIIGLGGSSTNDAGTGMAAALGVKFFKSVVNNEQEFIPTGGTLEQITRIDLSNLDDRIRDTEIIAMCDIDNPLYGENGAAYIFAPQKGADKETVEKLDIGLRHIARIVALELNQDNANINGAGAAGGLGFGVVTFLDATLQMGIDTVLDTVNFDNLIKTANLVFTGEGKLDSQSKRGKVIAGVSKRAKEKDVPVVAVVGAIEGELDEIYDAGLTAAFSINRQAIDFDISKKDSEVNLYKVMQDITRFFVCK